MPAERSRGAVEDRARRGSVLAERPPWTTTVRAALGSATAHRRAGDAPSHLPSPAHDWLLPDARTQGENVQSIAEASRNANLSFGRRHVRGGRCGPRHHCAAWHGPPAGTRRRPGLPHASASPRVLAVALELGTDRDGTASAASAGTRYLILFQLLFSGPARACTRARPAGDPWAMCRPRQMQASSVTYLQESGAEARLIFVTRGYRAPSQPRPQLARTDRCPTARTARANRTSRNPRRCALHRSGSEN